MPDPLLSQAKAMLRHRGPNRQKASNRFSRAGQEHTRLPGPTLLPLESLA
jgi:hypothetical protein